MKTWIVLEIQELGFYPITKAYGPYSSVNEAEARRRERHFDLTRELSQLQVSRVRTRVVQVEEMPR